VLIITDTAYYIRWNIGLESNDTWELKELFNRDYLTEENITKFY